MVDIGIHNTHMTIVAIILIPFIFLLILFTQPHPQYYNKYFILLHFAASIRSLFCQLLLQSEMQKRFTHTHCSLFTQFINKYSRLDLLPFNAYSYLFHMSNRNTEVSKILSDSHTVSFFQFSKFSFSLSFDCKACLYVIKIMKMIWVLSK